MSQRDKQRIEKKTKHQCKNDRCRGAIVEIWSQTQPNRSGNDVTDIVLGPEIRKTETVEEYSHACCKRCGTVYDIEVLDHRRKKIR